jgi:hypothetical protein
MLTWLRLGLGFEFGFGFGSGSGSVFGLGLAECGVLTSCMSACKSYY